MHRNEIFYALICINNHVLLCLNSMLSTLTYTSQMNGTSKRINCTLLSMVQFMMSFYKHLVSLLGYVFETTVCVLNVLYSTSVASILYEIWQGKKQDFSYFRVWSCLTHVKKDDIDKLELRTKLLMEQIREVDKKT